MKNQHDDTIEIFVKLWQIAPLSWALIRTAEVMLLRKNICHHPILEVGCGDGLVSKLIFENKPGIVDVGIDLDSEELRRAKKTKLYKKLLQANIIHTEFRKNSFHTIFANGVLEHIPNLEGALEEIHRLLKPGGTLITTSPTNHYSDYLFYTQLAKKIGFTLAAKKYSNVINHLFVHNHLYDHKKWNLLLKKSGLQLIKYQYYLTSKQIAIHDFFLPFAIGTKLLKKQSDQMVLFSYLRKYFVFFLSSIFFTPGKFSVETTDTGASILLVAQKND